MASQRYPRFQMNGLNFNYNEMVEVKALALKKLFHDWGVILRRALKEESNLSTRSD
jgi:hypothetical protein